jgi:putative transposase
VSMTCRRYMQEGLDRVLNDLPKSGRPVEKMTGEVEAQLVLAACSKPPEGEARWTLGLLRDRLIELKLVDDISRMSVGRTLKKMKLSLGG